MSLKKLITLENLQSFYNKLPSWSKAAIKPSYNYSEINNTPTLGSAASKDVAAGGGNASSTQVVMGNDSRLTNSRTPTAHNQASNTVNAMTGYSKPSSAPATPAIQTSDSLNAAIGKLEYKADTNQTNILSVYDEGYAKKNLLYYNAIKADNANWSTSSVLRNGVRFTLNSDGTVTVNRESADSSNAYITLCINASTTEFDAKPYCDAEHVLSGCPSGGGSSTYALYAARSTYAMYDYGDGVVLSTTEVAAPIYIMINIYNGYNAQNLVFKPMICTKSQFDISPTYQPYALPNTAITPELIELVDSGAKNKTTLSNGSNTLPNRWYDIPVVDVKIGQTYVVNFGLITSTDTNDSRCQAIFMTGSTNCSDWMHFTRGSNINRAVMITGNKPDFLRLYPADSYATSEGDTVTWSNLMICTLAAWNVSQKYVPYRPNWDLVAEKPQITANISTAINDFNTTRTDLGYVGSSSTITDIASEYVVVRTYKADATLDRRIQIIESAGGVRKTRYYNGTSWSNWM